MRLDKLETASALPTAADVPPGATIDAATAAAFVAAKGYIDRTADGIFEMIDALEARLAAVETKSLTFGGAWEPGVEYAKSTLVQRSNSLWIALAATSSAPPSPSWRLIVRPGAAAAGKERQA